MFKAYLLLLFVGVVVLLTLPSSSLAHFDDPPKEEHPFPEHKPPVLPGYVPPKKEEPPKPQRHLSGVDEIGESMPCGCAKSSKCNGMKPPPNIRPTRHLLAEEVVENKLNRPMSTYLPPDGPPPPPPPYEPPPPPPPYGPPPPPPPYGPPQPPPPFGHPPPPPPYGPPYGPPSPPPPPYGPPYEHPPPPYWPPHKP